MISTRKKRNCKFILFNIFLIIIIIVACFFQRCSPYQIKDADNTMGIVCQVITALVCCIASMIGISFSIQDSSFLGITVKELRGLRSEKGYSLRAIMIISVIIVALNLLCYVFKFYVVSFGFSLAAVFFCCYIIWKEIPLMAKKDEAGLAILKSHIAVDTDASGIQVTVFDKALIDLLIHKNLKTTYEKLSYGSKDKEVNKKLLLKLLDLQTSIATELDTIESRQELRETVDAIYENLNDIVSFTFDLTETLENDLDNYTHYVTNTILGLKNVDDGEKACSRIIRRSLSTLDYSHNKTENDCKTDFLFSILISVITYSVSNNDFLFLSAAQEYFSGKTYNLSKSHNSTLLFSLVSLYLYYICELESLVPPDIRSKIKDYICSTEKRVEDHRVIYSWTQLFKYFSRTHSIDYSDYMRVFKSNEFSMEYHLLDSEAHWVIMEEDLAFNWFVANMLNCDDSEYNDFSSIFGEDLEKETVYRLKRLYGDCYKDRREFQLPDYMIKMLGFFGLNDTHKLFIIEENIHHTLFNYLTEIKKQEIINEAARLERLDEKELEKKIKYAVTDAIKKEWGFNAGLNLPDDEKYIRVLIEKAEAINFADIIIDFFVECIIDFYEKNLQFIKIEKDEEFDERIKELLAKNITAASSYGALILPHYIHDLELQSQYNEIIANTELFRSSILSHNFFIIDDGFSFNFQIDEVFVEKLNEDQLNSQVEKYKRADGQYVYEGTFMNREEVYGVIKEKAIIITLSAHFALDAQEGSIIKIVLFPKQED